MPRPPEYERWLDLLRGEFRSRDEARARVEAVLSQPHESVESLTAAIRQSLGLPANLQNPLENEAR